MNAAAPAGQGAQRGWVMLALLFAIALIGIGMAALGSVWETTAKREKENDLLFVGDQFRLALESYRQRSPGTDKALPKKLEDLLLDPRFPMTVRHLRRIYRDPVTGTREWGLLRDKDGGIAGIHSLSTARPLKTGNFPERYSQFGEAKDYRDWIFTLDQGGGLPSGQSAAVDGARATTGPTGSPAASAQTGTSAADPCFGPFQAAMSACAALPLNPGQTCKQQAVQQFAACRRDL